jgi:hypothetical protein
MRTPTAVIVEKTNGEVDVDFWMHRPTAERVRDEAIEAGHKVYFFDIKINTVIGLHERLLRSAEYWSLFNNAPEPVDFLPA